MIMSLPYRKVTINMQHRYDGSTSLSNTLTMNIYRDELAMTISTYWNWK
jgi:hypothetical protein